MLKRCFLAYIKIVIFTNLLISATLMDRVLNVKTAIIRHWLSLFYFCKNNQDVIEHEEPEFPYRSNSANSVENNGIVPKGPGVQNLESIVMDDNDWKYITRVSKFNSREFCSNILKSFDDKKEYCALNDIILHNPYCLAVFSLKAPVVDVGIESRVSFVPSLSEVPDYSLIYSIYINLRAHAMGLYISCLPRKVPDVSSFVMSDLFFGYDNQNNSEGITILNKIKIYLYFITICELKREFCENLDHEITIRSSTGGEFQVTDLEYFFVRYLYLFLDYNFYVNAVIKPKKSSSSFSKVHKDIIRPSNIFYWPEHNELFKRFIKLKESFIYLDIMNNISISINQEEVLPLYFVDRILSYIYKYLFCERN